MKFFKRENEKRWQVGEAKRERGEEALGTVWLLIIYLIIFISIMININEAFIRLLLDNLQKLVYA